MNRIIEKLIKTEWLYIVLAFLLPLLFYWTVFFGKSFGYDCAPSVMGNYPPIGQTLTHPNSYCMTILDPGAYVWAHVPNWVSFVRQYLSGHLPIWDQNIGTGLPLAADFISSAYYFILWPFALLFKLTQGNFFFLDIFFVLRYMLMSLGMYLFLRSFKLDKMICLIGSLSFFSAGYFILIPAMNHHNVDILLPFIGWSINNFYFSKRIKWIGISVLLLGLSMFGGMPESSIFILFFCSVYVFFLSFFYIRKGKIRFFIFGSLIIVGGLLISSLLYFQGLEFVFNGLSAHHGAGVQKWLEWKDMIMFILPKLFGGIGYFYSGYQDKLDFHPMGWNYLGSVISYLFLLSLFAIINVIKKVNKDINIRFFIFFLILSVILLLQNYGLVHFVVFEQFPVFYQTQFTKYSSALINFSMITVVAFFLQFIIIKVINKKIFFLYVFFIGFLFYINYHYRSIIFNNTYFLPRFGLAPNIFYAVILISLLSFVLFFIKRVKIVLLIVFIILFTEFYIYLPRNGDQNRRDTLRKPPAVKYLQSINDYSFRIFGLDNLLVPNLATNYDLSDIRILEPIWINRYFVYMQNFFATPDGFRITGIREQNATQSADIVHNPYFDLMSVKYVLAYSSLKIALNNDTTAIDTTLKANKPTGFLSKAVFFIDKESRDVLFEHAPGDVKVTLTKPTGAKYYYLNPALSPNSFGLNKGNGVKLIAKVYDEGGYIIDEQSITIDSANKKSDEKWFSMKLGPFPNSEESYNFTLELITDPLGNNAFDWSGWGGFEWDNTKSDVLSKYKLIYDKEMKIYENKDYIPRLRFINKTLCVKPNTDKQKNYDNVIKLMKNKESEIRNLAIVESNNCENKKYNPLAGKIIAQKFEDQEVSFTYSSTEDQYGVLSDAYYQGWNIYVNGKKGIIDPVDLAFRGFKLPKGNNVKVRIIYEPLIIKIGLLVTLITLGFSIFLIFSKKKFN